MNIDRIEFTGIDGEVNRMDVELVAPTKYESPFEPEAHLGHTGIGNAVGELQLAVEFDDSKNIAAMFDQWKELIDNRPRIMGDLAVNDSKGTLHQIPFTDKPVHSWLVEHKDGKLPRGKAFDWYRDKEVIGVMFPISMEHNLDAKEPNVTMTYNIERVD